MKINFIIQQLLILVLQNILNLSFNFINLFNKRSNEIFKLLENINTNKYNSNNFKNSEREQIVIFEMFNINENIIAFYLWSLIFKKRGSRCYVYPLKIKSKLYNPISYNIYKKLGFKFLDWKLDFNQQLEVNNTIKKFNFKKINKKNFINFKFRGILVGDLIYDHHLRYKYLPTTEINSKDFIKTLRKGLEILIFWDDFFKKEKVKNICYSHSPYLLGIPGRVALKYNIDSLCVGGNSVFRFNKKILYLGEQFINAKSIIKKFYNRIGNKKSNELKRKFIKNFQDIMSGKNKDIIGTVAYSQKNTFKKNKNNNLGFDKTKFNILISAHDFYEGPNTWGKFLFPDFYEWLNFLSKYIEKDKKNLRHWFVKPHPDGSDDQMTILKEIFRNNKNVTILPKNITHSQLVSINIKFVLTARGSVTYQYAYFGVNTLICSNIGLYKDFSFVLKSKSKMDYLKKLKNMERISKKKPNINDAINFFTLLNLFIWGYENEFIFPDISKHLKKEKLFFNQARAERYKVETFKYIKKHLSKNQINKIFSIMDSFINNKKQLVMDAKFIEAKNHHQL